MDGEVIREIIDLKELVHMFTESVMYRVYSVCQPNGAVVVVQIRRQPAGGISTFSREINPFHKALRFLDEASSHCEGYHFTNSLWIKIRISSKIECLKNMNNV